MVGCRETLPPSLRERETYSTARVLLNRRAAARDVVAIVPLNGKDQETGVVVEAVPIQLHKQLESLSLVFATEESLRNTDRLQVLRRSLELYANRYPGIAASIRSLLWSLHILDAEDDYDVSHSSPDLPFSAFVSIPAMARPDACARVFESLLHETMHLQLTHLERLVPLIRSCDGNALVYSPWRGEVRPPRGILHALYVFHVIERFWSAVLAGSGEDFEREFAQLRCGEIAEQFAQVRGFEEHPALTDAGRELVQALAE
jgi:HEXXH motif-containing protein